MTKDVVLAAVKKYGDQSKAARGLGVTLKTIRWALYRADAKGGDPAMPQTEDRGSVGVSAAAFCAKFDYTERLHTAIRKLCRNAFVDDADMRTESQIPIMVFGKVAEQKEFEEFNTKSEGKRWWGSKENVATVKAKQQKWGVVR